MSVLLTSRKNTICWFLAGWIEFLRDPRLIIQSANQTRAIQ